MNVPSLSRHPLALSADSGGGVVCLRGEKWVHAGKWIIVELRKWNGTLNASKESTIFSPISILNTLLISYAGANNETANQIAKVIGKDKTRDEIIDYYMTVFNNCKEDVAAIATEEYQGKKDTRKRIKLSEEENVQISMANKLFVNDKIILLSGYQKMMDEKFIGQIKQISFEDGKKVADIVNNFVKENTKGIIKRILESDDIQPSESVISINAIHFLGIWEEPFDSRRKAKFNSIPSRKIFVMDGAPTNKDWNYREGKDWRAVGIPYKSRKAWFFIVLPNKTNGLGELLQSLNYDFIKDVTTREESRALEVTIPVMKFEESIDLKSKFSKLGITDLFNDKCDLSLMLEGNHCINKAIHKASICVDEKGTEAAAISLDAKMACSAIPSFEATHPFLYFITTANNSVNISPKSILFIGTFC